MLLARLLPILNHSMLLARDCVARRFEYANIRQMLLARDCVA